MKISPITPAIGARVTDVHLGEAARDPERFAQIKSALLKHKVLFFRGQDITRADHQAFARCFGELERHPVLDSDPQYPGLALIYRSESRHSYENVYHSDGLWRKNPSMGAVLRCTAQEANFFDLDLTDADFEGTDLTGSNFRGCILTRTDFSLAVGLVLDPSRNRLKDTQVPLATAVSLAESMGMRVPALGDVAGAPASRGRKKKR